MGGMIGGRGGSVAGGSVAGGSVGGGFVGGGFAGGGFVGGGFVETLPLPAEVGPPTGGTGVGAPGFSELGSLVCTMAV